MANVSKVVVTAVEPYDHGYKRRVHLLDTESGETYLMTFGSSITEGRARFMAPLLVKKIKRGNAK
ncbi:hypothetical protein GCM10023310_72300 [Paenibacillus vulneris]|uniref:Uncharacterized protein n=1 Tax=Paenibacillus vulneris TaxID=1133364 RepID=A0ABW3UYW7_9BACL